jgi:hypothetical protein
MASGGRKPTGIKRLDLCQISASSHDRGFERATLLISGSLH